MLVRRSLLLLAVSPVMSSPDSLNQAVERFTQGRSVRDGKVQLLVPELVENGNSVPVEVGVLGTERVLRLLLLAELNPSPEVAQVQFGPRSARPQIQTRIRLATSQTLIALAELADGSIWRQQVRVLVTLAACVEGG
jgi:sulfur-oxidizing protein SoxY